MEEENFFFLNVFFPQKRGMWGLTCRCVYMEWGVTVHLWENVMLPEFNSHSVGDLCDKKECSYMSNIHIWAAWGWRRRMIGDGFLIIAAKNK